MRYALALLPLLALLGGCPSSGTSSEPKSPPSPSGAAARGDAQPAAQGEARVVLQPKDGAEVSVHVEVARTQEEQRQGLMYRMHLDDDAGMLFLFDRPQQLTFWMRNTFIPLDMIFIEPSLQVLGVVENAEPRTDSRRMVPGLSQYVLEVNAGFAQRHGITAGTQIRVEGVTLPAAEGASP